MPGWSLNEKGEVYKLGSSYPLQKRISVILAYISLGSISAAAKSQGVSYNFVSKLITLFQRNANLNPTTSTNRRPQRIPHWMEVYLEALFLMYPELYIREAIQMLMDDFGLPMNVVPSISSVRRLLQRLNITRKKCAHVAKQRFSPHVLQLRHRYIQWRATINPSLMFFLDETAFTSETDMRQYGREICGYGVASYRNKNPSQPKSSVIGLCGYDQGFIQAVPTQGNYDTAIFNNTLRYQILPLLPMNTFLLMDNASIHNVADIARILSVKNITLVKLPPYSYDLNPIEMTFGMAKAMARQTPGALEDNMNLAIIDAFLKVPVHTVRNFYRKSWQIMR
jgi:transposase